MMYSAFNISVNSCSFVVISLPAICVICGRNMNSFMQNKPNLLAPQNEHKPCKYNELRLSAVASAKAETMKNKAKQSQPVVSMSNLFLICALAGLLIKYELWLSILYFLNWVVVVRS